MGENNTNSGGGINIVEIVLGIVIIVALVFLFKYIWQGLTWLFNEYVDLLHVN